MPRCPGRRAPGTANSSFVNKPLGHNGLFAPLRFRVRRKVSVLKGIKFVLLERFGRHGAHSCCEYVTKAANELDFFCHLGNA